jgi:two-component system, OmpR family, sensor histidine kinase VanS
MRSLSAKWMLTVVVLIALMISLILAANIFFLEDYYVYKTKSVFQTEYEILSEQYKPQNRDFLDIIRERSAETGLKYLVSDRNYAIVMSSVPEFRQEDLQKLSRDKREILDNLKSEIFYGSVSRETSSKSDVMFVSRLKRDTFLFVIKPMEQLKDNATIANDFLIFMGVITLFLSVFLTYLVAQKAVKPIVEITGISRRIAALDFSQKYQGKSKDEIGILGDSINHISGELDKTINNLKKEMELQKRFLASVSHEFKTPVGLIRGYSESLNLDMAQSEEERKEFSEIIISEADRLNDLVSDLLLLIRIDSTSFHLSKSDFDLSETIRSIKEKYEKISNNKKYALKLSIPETFTYHGDEKRITQVLENLLNNAIRHCVTESEIIISLIKEEERILLSIYNDGSPIPDGQLHHIFDPFYSIHDSRSRDKSGTGLGLSIIKSIVEKHGGTCSLINQNKGVCAQLTLG